MLKKGATKGTPDHTKDQLVWKWLDGQPTSQDEFGDPTRTTGYALCVYAANGRLLSATVPADGMKWSRMKTKGYKYKEELGTADGVQKILLKGSVENKAKAVVKGKGAALPDPVLGALALPVTARLMNNDTSVCLEATYDVGDVIKNDTAKFKAKAQ